MSEMTDRGAHPRRYFSDREGRRVLIGLTIEETFEFENLDNLRAPDMSVNHLASDNQRSPLAKGEQRWWELYHKHEAAWRRWLVET